MSVLIPAFNEEKNIAAKIENLLASDYPRQLLEVLVGDDASTDRTASIVCRYPAEQVRLISSPVRLGKSTIQNELASRASGTLLVFTDADCFFPPHTLNLLAENFADPSIGLVTNCPSYSNADETSIIQAENLYWAYERWIRHQESERGLLAMASGSLVALRRELWAPIDPSVGDDFVLPLRVAIRGFRNLLDPRISAVTELTQKDAASMLCMKIRIISKDFRGLLNNPSALNPFRTGSFALALLSHKLLRWLVPYFLLTVFVNSILLLNQPAYALGLVVQALFLGVALAGLLDRGRRLAFPFSAITSFCLVNCAALLGTIRCLTGRTTGHWRTVR